MSDKDVARSYQHLRLNKDMCLGLREAVRPLIDPIGTGPDGSSRMEDFCARLYLAHYSLESDPDLEDVDFPIDQHEIMIINNFVSVEDGEWAKAVLHQTRQVLYELITGHEAVRLASSKDVHHLLDDVNLGPIDANALEEPEEQGPEEPNGEKV